MVAGVLGVGGRVAEVVLGVEFGADFVDGFFDGVVLEGGEVRATGGSGGNFEGVALDLILGVLDDPDGGVSQIDAVTGVFRVGSLHAAGDRRSAKGAGGCRANVIVAFGLGLQFGPCGGEADAVNGDVGELRFAEHFA